MQTARYPARERWAELLARPVMEAQDLDSVVAPVMEAVRSEGDAALFRYAERFDKVKLPSLKVSEAEFAAAEAATPEPLKAAIRQACANVRRFHEAQAERFAPIETMPGVRCWRKSVPIAKVGLYVPGGTAPLFSSLVMLAVPAQAAGCERIVVCTPPQADGAPDPTLLFVAKHLGLTDVFVAGGAQAVAAMAYGTESVPACYKIFGPGNQYVTAAKQRAARQGVAIDLPAGPSEVAVMADASAEPAFVAADLLSQAEHGADSQVLFVTDSPELLAAVEKETLRQIEELPRKEIATKALENSRAVLLANREEVIEFANAYAAEHLIVAMENAEAVAERITEAGSIFVGHYTPESAGDYASGTNHTLPTNGFARAYSGVSLDSFVKKITVQELTPDGLRALGPAVMEMAAAERLDAHRLAVKRRLDKLG